MITIRKHPTFTKHYRKRIFLLDIGTHNQVYT